VHLTHKRSERVGVEKGDQIQEHDVFLECSAEQ
jgi:hypothetical protein